ncbi:hypothetical protein [Scytonema sp. NUACC26]|uniref:hypothetical protein n=1 Tax=Scytonema sp. NUACC26 TaxID=3140176 RepID=UPI0038B2BA30
MPKIVETAAAFNTVELKSSEMAVGDRLVDDASEAYVSENTTYKVVTNNYYEPPNYGGPDSKYGSGTR